MVGHRSFLGFVLLFILVLAAANNFIHLTTGGLNHGLSSSGPSAHANISCHPRALPPIDPQAQLCYRPFKSGLEEAEPDRMQNDACFGGMLDIRLAFGTQTIFRLFTICPLEI